MRFIGLAFGFAFGFVLAAARLSDYDVIHGQLVLQDFHLFLTMGAAVAIAAPPLWLLRRNRWHSPVGGESLPEPSRIERRHVLGSTVFGLGWAVAGSCPGPALAMTAGGGLLGVCVMLGLVVGLALRERAAPSASGRVDHVRGTSALRSP